MQPFAMDTLIESLELTDPKIWGADVVIKQAAFDAKQQLTSADLNGMIDCSLLRWPYFSLLRNGAVPDVKAYTVSRNVIGHMRDGFMNPSAVRTFMAAGATLKLNKVSDWHEATKASVAALERRLPAAVDSFVFWTPPGQQGMLPHRDASHVVVMQLEGRKRWWLYASDTSEIRSGHGLDVDTSSVSHDFIMEPGDVLYLPHGWAHEAQTAGPEASLHVTYTLTEPTPEQLLEGLMEAFVDKNSALLNRFHHLDLTSRSEAVQGSLHSTAQVLSDIEWIDYSLRLARKVTG